MRRKGQLVIFALFGGFPYELMPVSVIFRLADLMERDIDKISALERFFHPSSTHDLR